MAPSRRSPVPRSAEPARGAGLAFGWHQAFEYGLALLLAETAIHLGGAMETALLVGAALVAALAALSKGPLGALPALSPALHRVLDVVLGLALALSPLASLHHLDVIGLLLAEVAAVVLLRLVFVTRYDSARPIGGRVRRSPPTRPGPDPVAPAPAGPAAQGPPTQDRLEQAARVAGALLGRRAARRPR